MNVASMREREPCPEVLALVRRRTGLVFTNGRQAAFETSVRNAMQRAGQRDIRRYVVALAAAQDLMDDLVSEITVGETYFFREPRQIDLIKREIFPDLRSQRGPGHRLRMWSAGCASGEEPFTLAIVAREFGLKPPPYIVATDLSRRALAHAARASYTRWSLRGVAPELISANFSRHGDWFELDPAVRRSVEFGYLNLAEDAYPSLASGICRMDLILCRNVLIYFDRETVTQVVHRLVDCLADGGWLVLGPADPVASDIVACEVFVTPAGLAYRRRTRKDPPHRTIAPLTVLSPLAEPAPALPPQQETRPETRQVGSRRTATIETVAEAEQVVRSLANQGDLEAAGRRCAVALKQHPESAELIYLHAVLLAEAGRHSEAARAIRGALYLDHNLAVAHMALGSWLVRLGEREAARRSFRNAKRLLESMAPDAVVPASDGERAARLAGMVRTRLALLTGSAA